MSLLHVPYILNLAVLTPIALTTLLGGERAAGRAFQGKFADSRGIRAILGAQWTAILVCSAAGLFFPVAMSPVLIFQVVYKVLWIAVFAVPRCLTGRSNELPWGMTAVFLFIIVTYPWVIPWGVLFAGS